TGPNLSAYTSDHDPEFQNSWGLSRAHILSSIEGTLERLGTTYVDIYYVHQFDYTTPLEETMEALNDLVRSGKVRYLAYDIALDPIQKCFLNVDLAANYIAKSNGWAQFVCMQNLYSLLYREEEREMIPLLKDMGVGMCPWSPLAGGLLAARNRSTARASNDNYINKKVTFPVLHNVEMVYPQLIRFYTHEIRWQAFPNAHVPGSPDYITIERVEELATKRDVKMAQISVAWWVSRDRAGMLFALGNMKSGIPIGRLLSKPFMTAPIIGVTKKEQLVDLVKAIDIKLTSEEIAYLEEP
ncbi:hypothetical protein HDU93_008571, partial [Gonapodya sp. JEL0774]